MDSYEFLEVIPALGGGVGNQMFQIAMAHIFARQIGGVVALDESVWTSYGQGHPTGHYLDGLFSKIRRSTLRNDAHQVCEGQWKPGCRPQLSLPRGVRQVCIRGYWQLPASWECEHQEIRDLFQFEVKQSLRSGVHIRGGDYKYAHQQSRSSYHSQPGRHYYEQALANLSRFPEFYSDDPAFLRSLAPSVLPVLGSEEDHFKGMAECAELVLSKSTFAWWAAFLGAVSFVIMPAIWFRDREYQPSWAMRIEGWQVFSPNSTLSDFHRWQQRNHFSPETKDAILEFPIEDWAPWNNKSEILNDLICITRAQSYLEVTCGTGANLRTIECERKIAVDEAYGASACDSPLFQQEPEHYFENLEHSVDLIMVGAFDKPERFGRVLRLAARSLSANGVLACDGLKDHRHYNEWSTLNTDLPEWLIVGIDC